MINLSSFRPFTQFATACAATAALVSLSAGAQEADKYQAIRDAFPDVEITAIQPSPIEGLLELEIGGDFFYVTADGSLVVRGDIFRTGTFENITEARRSDVRMRALTRIDDATTIKFAAKDEKYVVTVFTDIDCGYCRKLHREMDGYNSRGISVRYLFFPRSGPGTESWFKADAVWCAESRQKALTMAKSNLEVESKDCGTTPVAQHYALVTAMGLRGTPAIFTPAGQYVMGYRSPDELLEILETEADGEG